MSEQLAIDGLTFEVRRSPRRKTLGLTVDRGGELVVSAPPGVGGDLLAHFVREKRFWLYTKIAEKEARQRPIGGKEFVSGEGFPYLGRSHRLLLVAKQDTPLKLVGGRFRLLRSEASEGRKQFVRWYTDRGRDWLPRRVEGWVSRMGVKPVGVEVRDLGFRWGSCGKAGIVNFHWAAMLLPPSVVDYVIVHELSHLVEAKHTPEFWQRVARALQDHEQLKSWLAEHGGRHMVL